MQPVATVVSALVMGWGPVTFGSPLLAWGMLACVMPVLIHLVLRQRPRRQVLPAMRFLAQSHQASTRAHRLKHLLLLLSRMTLILLLVGILMKAGCAPGGEATARPWLGEADEPVSAVICLDDSASMGYRFQGRSRLRRATEWARNLLQEANRFPAGSQAAIVTASSDVAEHTWTRDLQAARKRIDAVHVADHDRCVAMLLRKAYPLVSTGRHTRREIYLFSDLTESSWRDSPPPAPRELTGFYVLDVGQVENRNVALKWLQAPAYALLAGVPAAMTVRVRSGDQPADPVLEIVVDAQPRGRQAVGHLAADSEVEVELTLPPMAEGTHTVAVNLQPADALACDNGRFARVLVGEPSRVVVGHGRGSREVAALTTAMLAPATLPASRHRFAVEQVSTHELTRAHLDNVLAVILADVDGLTTTEWRALNRYVEAGGMLLVLPGPNTSVQGCRAAGALLPASVASIEHCSEAITLAATELTHPFLKPFADPAIDSLNDRRVFRRLALDSLKPDAKTVAPFSDRRPALVERRAGGGRVVLLAFSPARDWGQFGTQAGPMIVLLHTMLAEVSPPVSDTASFTAGRAAARRIEDFAGTAVLLCDAGNNARQRPLSVENGLVRLPTDRAGNYRLLADEPGKPALLHYTVNVAETESDARRIDPAAIEGMFPARLAGVARDAETLARLRPRTREGVRLLVPVALALLALLFVESLFANRFYGSGPGPSSEV